MLDYVVSANINIRIFLTTRKYFRFITTVNNIIFRDVRGCGLVKFYSTFEENYSLLLQVEK
jgi:hypothetical protein